MNQSEFSESEQIVRLKRAVSKIEAVEKILDELEFCEPYETVWDATGDIKRGGKTLRRLLAQKEAEKLRKHFNRYHQREVIQVVA